jgi:hypothetical protein
LGEGRGEGKNLAMQEVIAKSLYPTAVFRLKDLKNRLFAAIFEFQ